MTITRISGIVLVTAMLTGNAYAADDIDIEERLEDWNGWYAGLQVGYTFGEAIHTFSNAAPTGDAEPSGIVGGLHVGHNVQQSNVVFGFEGDVEASGVDGSYLNTTLATSSGSTDLSWQASVRARLGTVVNEHMIYATGGFAMGDFDFNGGPAAPFPPINGYSETLNGWTAGVGVESFHSENTSWRIEYRYIDFGDANGSLSPAFAGVTMPVEVKTSTIRFGVSKHF